MAGSMITAFFSSWWNSIRMAPIVAMRWLLGLVFSTLFALPLLDMVESTPHSTFWETPTQPLPLVAYLEASLASSFDFTPYLYYWVPLTLIFCALSIWLSGGLLGCLQDNGFKLSRFWIAASRHFGSLFWVGLFSAAFSLFLLYIPFLIRERTLDDLTLWQARGLTALLALMALLALTLYDYARVIVTFDRPSSAFRTGSSDALIALPHAFMALLKALFFALLRPQTLLLNLVFLAIQAGLIWFGQSYRSSPIAEYLPGDHFMIDFAIIQILLLVRAFTSTAALAACSCYYGGREPEPSKPKVMPETRESDGKESPKPMPASL